MATADQIRQAIERVTRYADTAETLGIKTEVLNGIDGVDVHLLVCDLRSVVEYYESRQANDPKAAQAELLTKAHAMLTRMGVEFTPYDLISTAQFLGER